MELMSAHHQWSSRPADERFWNLEHLAEYLRMEREGSREVPVDLQHLRTVDLNGDVCLVGRQDRPAQLTHWSFGQLATRCKCPADFLRTIKSNHTVGILNDRLEALAGQSGLRDANVLLRRNGNIIVRAVTTTDYTRFWNIDVVSRLLPALESGWVTPPARPGVDDPRARPATEADILPNQGNFGLSVKVGDLIAPAGVYCSDRDMFVFLVHPERTLDAGLMRGAFIWNSETGAGSFKIRTFMLEHVCGNHICWGASHVVDVSLVHRGKNNAKFAREMIVKLREYADSSVSEDELLIKRAKHFSLGSDKEEVVEWLFGKKAKLNISKTDIEAAYDVAEEYEHTAGAPPTSAWGFVHGLTRYSQRKPYADERNRLDVAGGRLLELVASNN